MKKNKTPPLSDGNSGIEGMNQGKWIKSTRESCGLTQEEYSSLLGCPITNLRNWEQGITPRIPESILLVTILLSKFHGEFLQLLQKPPIMSHNTLVSKLLVNHPVKFLKMLEGISDRVDQLIFGNKESSV